MKIKRERQVRLDELLKYVWDNDVANAKFIGSGKYDIYVDSAGEIDVDAISYIAETDLFTITEEVEITKDKKLNLVYINGYKKSYTLFDSSIKKILEEWGNATFTNNRPKFIYLQNDDGSIGELIWSKERGLID